MRPVNVGLVVLASAFAGGLMVTVAPNQIPEPPPAMVSQQRQQPVQETLPQPPSPVAMPPEPEAPIALEPPAPSSHSVTLTPGTLISVRTVEPLGSDRNAPGDSF